MIFTTAFFKHYHPAHLIRPMVFSLVLELANAK